MMHEWKLICPNCGSDDIDLYDFDNYGSEYVEDGECHDCGKRILRKYYFFGIEAIDNEY